jgi:uncharacterized protein (DUF1697 family)
VATRIVLLRGINLGPSRRVRMEALRELLGSEGYGNVRTYVQSGNVLLESALEPARLEAALDRQLAAGLGFDIDVFVRTPSELKAVLARDPLGSEAFDRSRYLITFLRKPLDPERAARLAAEEFSPERLALNGREIYSWHPGGVGRSELAKQLSERSLGVTATARNWNTLEKLLALAR